MGAVTASSVLLVAIFQANFDGAINQPPFRQRTLRRARSTTPSRPASAAVTKKAETNAEQPPTNPSSGRPYGRTSASAVCGCQPAGPLEVRHTSLAVAPKESSQRATRSRCAIQRLARRTSSGAPRPLLRPTRRLHIHPRSRHPADRRSSCWHRARQATSRSTETSPPNSVSKINYFPMAADCLNRECPGRLPPRSRHPGWCRRACSLAASTRRPAACGSPGAMHSRRSCHASVGQTP